MTQHINTEYLSECLTKYHITKNHHYLTEIYKQFSVLVKHTLDKILRNTKVYKQPTDKENIIQDATTRLIIRIIKRPDYYILPEHWISKAYQETIKQLYSTHNIKWDRLESYPFKD